MLWGDSVAWGALQRVSVQIIRMVVAVQSCLNSFMDYPVRLLAPEDVSLCQVNVRPVPGMACGANSCRPPVSGARAGRV